MSKGQTYVCGRSKKSIAPSGDDWNQRDGTGERRVYPKLEAFRSVPHSVKTDSDLFDFLSYMGQANSDTMDEEMQLFYKAVQAYNGDPGHVNDLSKIRECLDLAIAALAAGDVSVAAVTRIRENVTGMSAASETAQAKPSVPEIETTEEPPQLTKKIQHLRSKCCKC